MGKEQVTEKSLVVSLFSLLAGPGFKSSEEGRSMPECQNVMGGRRAGKQASRQGGVTDVQVSPNCQKQQPLNTRLHREKAGRGDLQFTTVEHIMNWREVASCTGLSSPPADCLPTRPR